MLGTVARLSRRTLTESLVIALTPQTETLPLVRDHYVALAGSLPSLKTLLIRGLKGYYRLREVSHLLEACPNLQNLYAVDWLSKNYPNMPNFSLKFSLDKLKKLVLGEVEFEDLQRLWFAALQDLEFYGELYEDTEGMWSTRRLVDALVSSRKTLKKFHYAHLLRDLVNDSSSYNHYDFASTSYEAELPRRLYETDASLQKFEHLEELVIEQAGFTMC
ncbi:hypothetical protein VTO42DRAFT_8321 [Malbranchea cinnamomea]